MSIEFNPSEATMRANPSTQYPVLAGPGKTVLVWFESFEHGDSFSVGSAEDGDCGDSYDSYAEMTAAITAEMS